MGNNTIEDTGGTGIDSSATDENWEDIVSNIHISGSGSLTITETAPYDGYGVYTKGELTIEDATLYINSSCTGLWTESGLTVTDGKIVIINSRNNYFGIVVNNGDASIAGSVLVGNKQPLAFTGEEGTTGFFCFYNGMNFSGNYSLADGSVLITYNPGAGPFEAGTDTGILSDQESTAQWAISDGKGGISYTNGVLSGFTPIPDVTVNEAAVTPPVKSIELSLPYRLRVRILNTGDVATGELTLALTGANANAFVLPATTLNSLAVGDRTEIAIAPVKGLARGNYTATLTVGGEGISPVTLEITHTVTSPPTGNADMPQVDDLKAWNQDGMLHVVGLTAGIPWSVYSIAGIPVYNGIADSAEADITLPARGMYIVKSGNSAVKVVY